MKIGFYNQDSGDTISEWNLNPSQERFMATPRKFVLFSGGVGCGKSLMLTLKGIEMALKYPNNYILMGRLTYPELRDTLMKEFFTTCPEYLIKDYFKAENRVVFHNKSEIIFRHLDKMAEAEIRSLNLGSFFIDQAEEIPYEVFMELRRRLRRDVVADGDRRGYLSCNPALTWLYREFKQLKDKDGTDLPKDEYEVIEASTLENERNLPAEYVADLLKHPESFKKQYVYGVWDESLLSDRVVFDREYVFKILDGVRKPIREYEGLEIFKEYISGHRYQIGIDAAEGGSSGDDAAICIVDLDTEEEAASWAGKLPPDVTAEKAVLFANLYQDKKYRIMYVPEMNSVGLALLNKLEQYEGVRIYRREEFDKTTKMKLEKIGWRTTKQSKALLISRFRELLRLRNPKVYSEKTASQFKSFVYTDDAHKSGAGAEQGFHDDRIIALLLAFWQRGEVKPGGVHSPTLSSKDIQTSLSFTMKNGKARPKDKNAWKPVLTSGLRV